LIEFHFETTLLYSVESVICWSYCDLDFLLHFDSLELAARWTYKFRQLQ